MNRTAACLLILELAVLCSACSTRKTVGVLAAKWNDQSVGFWDNFSWNVGQHLDCWYAEGKLYCIPGTTHAFYVYDFDKFLDKDRKPLSRQAILTGLSVPIVHFLERHRQFVEEHPNVGEAQTYIASFSSSPSDYSLWDCYKTGLGSPALSCNLTARLDRTQQESLQPAIEASKYERDVLLSLSPESLVRACGAPRETAQSSVSRTLAYRSARNGVLVRFSFDSPDARLSTIESSEQKGADGHYPAEHIFWWVDSSATSLDEIPQIRESMPCLAR